MLLCSTVATFIVMAMLDVNGQPVAAFIYHDAMTESRCDTPHLFAKGERHSKQGKTISNRMFADALYPIIGRQYMAASTTRASLANAVHFLLMDPT